MNAKPRLPNFGLQAAACIDGLSNSEIANGNWELDLWAKLGALPRKGRFSHCGCRVMPVMDGASNLAFPALLERYGQPENEGA